MEYFKMSLRLLKSFIHLYRQRKKVKGFKHSIMTVTDQESSFGNYTSIGKSDIRKSSIDDFSYISHDTKICRTTIGKFCSIGPNSLIGGLGKHPTNLISTHPIFYSPTWHSSISFVRKQYYEEFAQTIIGSDVWIGANVTVLDGIEVGCGAIIAAGAVVTKNVPDYAVIGGVPAKIIKYRFTEKEIEKLLKLRWWEYPHDTLSRNHCLFRHSDVNKIEEVLKLAAHPATHQ
jgi:acetyltransferase-like isoleucine patch superfamily enzyme